ncbi:MAG TPA: hypothetical protein VMK66_08095 [Myxococcales bacterium]|nr:hypothetical protein [Myxococcales bacterium]
MATEPQGSNGEGTAARILGNFNPDDAQQMLEQGREAVDQALNAASAFIRERPIACLAGALALGWLLGKIASR